MTKKLYFALFILLCALVLSACGKSNDSPSGAVESYITALVNKDSDRMSALSCAAWEEDARLEFESFQAITTRLDGLSCTATGSSDEVVPVVCEGKIIATYNNEDQDFELSARTYKVINQGGEYLVCGYQ